MKWVFLAIAVVLSIASGVVWAMLPDKRTDKTVLTWVTDANPARNDQVRTFHEWLAREHPDVDVELRLDMGNNDTQKKIMQGVSGVGGDLQDMWAGGQLRYFRAMALNTDITEVALERGFDPSKTYDAVLEEITMLGTDDVRRQYQFPCNVGSAQYYLNLEQLVDADGNELFPAPPKDWTVRDFEEYGLAWVDWANRPENNPGGRRRFLAGGMNTEVMLRMFGGDLFNETLTGPGLDERVYTGDGLGDFRPFVEMLRTRERWTNRQRILPSQSDLAGIAAAAGYGGASLYAFNRGDFLLFEGGRYHLIQFREFNKNRVAQGRPPIALDTRPPVKGVTRTAFTGCRSAMVYSGGDNKDEAAYFLEYLASPDYNNLIVYDADGMPPNPEFARSDAFLNPVEDPERGVYLATEATIHRSYLKNVEENGLARSYSPFVLLEQAQREKSLVEDEIMNNLAGVTPDRAADVAAARIRRIFDEELDRMPEDDPRRDAFDEWSELQRKVDQRKAAGRKIPRSWIKNPFHLRYYDEIGMIEEDAPAETSPTAAAAKEAA